MGQAQLKYTPNDVNLGEEVVYNHVQFCEDVLKIGSKSGKIIPLIHNKTQRELLKLRDKQLRETGRVRIIIVKARRHGVSTGIAAIGFNNALKADLDGEKYGVFILAHREQTCLKLFDIVNTFHSYSGEFAPKLSSCSKTEMIFKETNSSYSTGTAGKDEKSARDIGRGMTNHFLHISELAHMKYAKELASGLFETVGDEVGTEIYLETTANGEGDYFHSQYLLAKQGETEYAPFFAPWYWDENCKRTVPANFKLTVEEQAYKKLYNLTDEQMAWKQNKEKIQGRTEKEGKLMFKQEYPANDVEAFQYSAVDSFIPVESVIRAMNTKPYRSYGAIIASYDPSECTGNDEDAFVYGQGIGGEGSNIWGLEYKRFDGIPQQVQYLKNKLDGNIKIDMLVIDVGGGGRQIYQILREDGYTLKYRIKLINYGPPADEPDKFKNKKAEMSFRCREALLNDTSPPAYPNDEKLKMEMTIEGSNGFDGLDGILEMEKKKDLIKRGHKSPNGYDAVRQLYAFKFVRKHVMGSKQPATANSKTPVFHSLKKRRRR
jgi:hypothetical protein